MPINYKKYPSNWKDLRKLVLYRAGNKCEFCDKENGSVWWSVRHAGKTLWVTEAQSCELYGQYRPVKCVLTVAHLDHDESNHNVSIERLRALCQLCHLQYDVKEKGKRRELKKNQAVINL